MRTALNSILITMILLFSILSCSSQKPVKPSEVSCCIDDWSQIDLKRIQEYFITSFQIAKANNLKNSIWLLVNEMKNETGEKLNTRIIMQVIRKKIIEQYDFKFIFDDNFAET